MSNPRPWPKGTYPTYSAFVIEVGVRKDRDGSWRSYHRLQDASDAQTAEGMGPSNGMEEASFALLSEAVRTETLLQLIILMSNSPELQRNLEKADSPPQDLIEKLNDVVLKQAHTVLEKTVSQLVKEIVSQVHHGLRHQTTE